MKTAVNNFSEELGDKTDAIIYPAVDDSCPVNVFDCLPNWRKEEFVGE